jgi:hypothetical protein
MSIDLNSGFKNITEPSLFNLLILITLVLIVYLTYLDTRRISLFTDIEYLDKVLSRYTNRMTQRGEFQVILDNKQKTINSIGENISKLLG